MHPQSIGRWLDGHLPDPLSGGFPRLEPGATIWKSMRTVTRPLIEDRPPVASNGTIFIAIAFGMMVMSLLLLNSRITSECARRLDSEIA